jgi:nitrogen fixation protein FixH
MNATQIMKHEPADSFAQREAAARLLWTAGIIGFFVIQAILWTVAITLTFQDPSHAVVEGYDQRALNWDAWQNALRASEALGWSGKLEISPAPQLDGRRDLYLQLTNRDGVPLTGATATIRIFHRARASEAITVPLQEVSPGSYVAEFQAQHSGRWTLELIALKSEQRYLEEFRMELDLKKSTVAVSRVSEKSRRRP